MSGSENLHFGAHSSNPFSINRFLPGNMAGMDHKHDLTSTSAYDYGSANAHFAANQDAAAMHYYAPSLYSSAHAHQPVTSGESNV